MPEEITRTVVEIQLIQITIEAIREEMSIRSIIGILERSLRSSSSTENAHFVMKWACEIDLLQAEWLS